MHETQRQAGSGECLGSWAPKKKEKRVESEGGQPGQRRKRSFRPGTVALWDICKFQKSTSFLIRKLLFVRWVRDITQQMSGDLWFQAMALLTLQEAAEMYIVNFFENANLCAIHGKHITLMPKDIQLA